MFSLILVGLCWLLGRILLLTLCNLCPRSRLLLLAFSRFSFVLFGEDLDERILMF